MVVFDQQEHTCSLGLLWEDPEACDCSCCATCFHTELGIKESFLQMNSSR